MYEQYAMLHETNIEEFMNRISDMLEIGWELHGDPIVIRYGFSFDYFQALKLRKI
jgi:hypothetical protein